MPLNDIQKPDKPADEAGRSEPADQNAETPEYFEGGYDPNPTITPQESPPPGGPAVKPQSAGAKPTDALKSVAEKGAKQVIKRGLDVATEGIAELPVVRNIVNWASEKLAKEAVKKWAYGLAAGVWGSIGPYATVIIIVVILLFVIIGPAFARIGKARRGADGNESPTPISIIDPEDRAILVELSKFTGNGSAVDATAIKALLDRINARIASGNSHFSDNTQAVTLIQEISTLCDQIIGGDKTEKTKQSLVDAIQKLIDLYLGDNPPPLPGDYFPPTGEQKPPSFNTTLHGRTVMHPESRYDENGDRIHHDVFKGFDSPGTGDAVDISTGSVGSPVYAMYDGSVSNGSQCVILASNSEPKIESWYCHVEGNGKTTAKRGEEIGKTAFTKGGHLHLEVWIGGKSVHTTQADLASKKYEQKGRYLWDHLVVIFNGFKASGN